MTCVYCTKNITDEVYPGCLAKTCNNIDCIIKLTKDNLNNLPSYDYTKCKICFCQINSDNSSESTLNGIVCSSCFTKTSDLDIFLHNRKAFASANDRLVCCKCYHTYNLEDTNSVYCWDCKWNLHNYD